jgi:hypothetical protein
VRPELLADSAVAAVCVPLAVIDLVEKRMPTRLLLPAYPSLVVLFGLVAAVEHNGATMILLHRARWHTLIPLGPALIAGAFTRLTGPSRMTTQGTAYG